MNNEIHPALDEFDAAMKTPRQRLAALAAENARLTEELEKKNGEIADLTAKLGTWVENWTHTLCVDCGTTVPKDDWDDHAKVCTGNSHAKRRALKAENERLTAELAEARKQPVALLPEITRELYGEWMKEREGRTVTDQWNIVLARHFREAAEARTKPTVDVEAVAMEIQDEWYGCSDDYGRIAARILRKYLTDAPAPPADELLMNALARVERETQRNTRRECAAMLRDASTNPTNFETPSQLADRMERGE